jgi:hypothetical protein
MGGVYLFMPRLYILKTKELIMGLEIPKSEIRYRDAQGTTVSVRTHKIGRAQNSKGEWVERLVPNTEQIEAHNSNPRYSRVGSIDIKAAMAKVEERETARAYTESTDTLPPHKIDMAAARAKAALTRARGKVKGGNEDKLTETERKALSDAGEL